MSRKFIGAVLAATLTLTSVSATQAQAGDKDLGKFIGAAATLYILGKALESGSQGHGHPQPKVHTVHSGHHGHGGHGYHGGHGGYTQGGYQGHKLPEIVGKGPYKKVKKPLPARCLREVRGAKTKYVLPTRCLSKHYQSARPLPDKCKLLVMAKGKPRPAYALRCLRKRGYTVAWN